VQTLRHIHGEQQAQHEGGEDEGEIDAEQQQVAAVAQDGAVPAAVGGGGDGRTGIGHARRPPEGEEQRGEDVARGVGDDDRAQPGRPGRPQGERTERAARRQSGVAEGVQQREPPRPGVRFGGQGDEPGAGGPVGDGAHLGQPGDHDDLPEPAAGQEARVRDGGDGVAAQSDASRAEAVDQWPDQDCRGRGEQPRECERRADGGEREVRGRGEVDQHEGEHETGAEAVDGRRAEEAAVAAGRGQAEALPQPGAARLGEARGREDGHDETDPSGLR
jgi:hypothetical protein